MLGGYAMTAITAITAQNTTGVSAIQTMDPAIVEAQITACVSDIGVDAVKIGMLGSADIVRCVARALAGVDAPIVLDPVLVATSGDMLGDDATLDAMRDEMFVLSSVITPNLPELSRIAGLPASSPDTIDEIARDIWARAGCAVLVKGGHGKGDRVTDYLIRPPDATVAYEAARLDTTNTHGTGCTLAAALAHELGAGANLQDAITVARAFVRAAISNAPGFGQGHGPLGHATVIRDKLHLQASRS